MKKLSKLNIDGIKQNIELTKEKANELKKDEESVKTFGTVLLVATILKETLNDYKKSSKTNKKMYKSFAKTCVKNASKLSKIKIK